MHTIKLRSAWERSFGTQELAEGQRVLLPDQPLKLDGGDHVCYTRSFNSPSGIDAKTPIELTLESWTGRLSITLDGCPLCQYEVSCKGVRSWDITGQLHGSHRLVVRLSPEEHSEGDVVHLSSYFALVIK